MSMKWDTSSVHDEPAKRENPAMHNQGSLERDGRKVGRHNCFCVCNEISALQECHSHEALCRSSSADLESSEPPGRSGAA